MRVKRTRTVLLAVSVGMAGCDADDSAERGPSNKPVLTEVDPGAVPAAASTGGDETPATGAPATPPTAAAQFDPTPFCEHRLAAMEASLARMPPNAPAPPPDWRDRARQQCMVDARSTVELIGAEAYGRYAACISAADPTGPNCDDILKREQWRAHAKKQERADVPDGDDACDVALPRGTGDEPPRAPRVTLGSRALCLDGAPLVAVTEGRIDPGAVGAHEVIVLSIALAEAIDAAAASTADPTDEFVPVLVQLDGGVVFEDLGALIFTLYRASANQYWIGSSSGDAGGSVYRPIYGPRVWKPGMTMPRVTEVKVTTAGVVIDGETIAPVDPAADLGDSARWDWNAIAGRLEARGESVDELAVAADADIPFRIIWEIIERARGPECPGSNSEDPRCWYTRVGVYG